MYFPLPQERITRILFCKNLPEAEFLCYRKVITDIDIESKWNRGFAGREEDSVSRTALLLILTSEAQPCCLWKTFTLPKVPPIRGSKPVSQPPQPAPSLCKLRVPGSIIRKGREGKGMKWESGNDSSREGTGWNIWALVFKCPKPCLGLPGKAPICIQREEF